MAIVLTGDTHGKPIERFSYAHNPMMRDLTEDDVVIVLGDFGVIWDYHGESEHEAYIMNWLNEKPWTTLAITGNHENYDRIMALPTVEKWNGTVRETGYEKVFVAADPTVLDICGNHILVMPGADSHDIYPVGIQGDYLNLGTGFSNLLNPEHPNFKKQEKAMQDMGAWYRVIGRSWWPQEAINIEACMDLLDEHGNEHFDFVLTHDAPNGINDWFSGGFGKFPGTTGQRYFDLVAKTLDYDLWCHGHFHVDRQWPHEKPWNYAPYEEKMFCFYHDVIKFE